MAGRRAARSRQSAGAQVMKELAWLRNRTGLRQHEMARRLGTTQSAISEMELLDSVPSHETMERYAAALGLRIRYTIEVAMEEITDAERAALED